MSYSLVAVLLPCHCKYCGEKTAAWKTVCDKWYCQRQNNRGKSAAYCTIHGKRLVTPNYFIMDLGGLVDIFPGPHCPEKDCNE